MRTFKIKDIIFLDGDKCVGPLKIELDSIYEGGNVEYTLFQEIDNIFDKQAVEFDYKEVI